MGDHAAAMAVGWDRASVLFNVLTKGKWTRYRLPKASACFDQAWYTEWPRIREVETERFLMDMHGLFYEVPRLAYGGHSWGIKPIGQHLRIVPDFCSWRGMLVLAGNQNTACTGNDHMIGEPQSNLWFGATDDLWRFGKPAGWGREHMAAFTANDYHKPSDKVRPDWDMSGAVQDLQFYWMVGYLVAQADKYPEWKPGTEFKAKRDEMLKK